MADTKSRARGMLLGLAVGDALGSPAEGLTWQEVQQRFGALTEFRDSFGPDEAVTMGARLKRKDFDRAMRFWRKAGLYTDDTQQAIALAYVLGRTGDLNGHDVAEEYVRLAGVPIMGPYFGVFRGTGDGFRTSVMAYRKSKDWKQCGTASAGNGAASRIAPVGFFYRGDADTMFWRVVEASLVTHRDPRGIAAAYAVAWLTASLSAAEQWPGTTMIEMTALATRDAEARIVKEYGEDLLVGKEQTHDFSSALLRVARALRVEPAGVLDEIVRAAAEHSQERVQSATDGFALASVVTAIIATLTQGGKSFETAVTRALALGGDTDSVAAIVGALCGAFHGLEGIPERWRDGVANSEGAIRYADALLDPMQRDLPDPLDAESRLCSEEESARAAMAAKVVKGA